MGKYVEGRFGESHRNHPHPASPSKKSGPVVMAGVITALVITASVYGAAGKIGVFAQHATVFSAKLATAQGSAQVISQKVNALSDLLKKQGSAKKPVSSAGAVAKKQTSSSSAASASSSSPSSSQASSGTIPSGMKPVKTVQYGSPTGSQYEHDGDICVYNETAHHSADIANQLAIRPDVHINLKKAPQVLIMHTHTTESFASSDTGYYDPNDSPRNPDKSKSVVKIGDEITKVLEQNGIGVLHDTTYHDYPEYNGAYARALTTIQNDLKAHPSIQVVLDIHRDAIEYSDGTRAKPTAVVNGKKAAQVMVVAPCDEAETALSVPDWQYNYRLALRIQQQLVKTYPTLARPLDLCPRRYDMQASHGSLLIEFGTDVNTFDEVNYSGQLFGGVLSQVLLGLQS